MLNDIILKYQLTFSIIENSSNPKTQLVAIINFFKYCEEENQSFQFNKFLNDFLPLVVNILKNSTVEFIDPYYLLFSKHLLNKAIVSETNPIAKDEIFSILELLNFQLLVLFYHLGEIDNGLIVLNDLLNSKSVINSGVSLDNYDDIIKKPSIRSSSLVDPSMFKINKAFVLLRRINYELSKLSSFSDSIINILLVESDNSEYGINNFGIVQELQCTVEQKRDIEKKNPFFENIIDVQEEGIEHTRKSVVDSSKLILKKFNNYLNLSKNQIRLKFSDLNGIYKGTSLGLGSSLIIPSAFLSNSTSRIRFYINGSSAFTGKVDEYGNVLKVPSASIESKIESAFYSWIKFVILPKENLDSAERKLNELHSKYSRKNLKLIGIGNIQEMFDYPDVVKIKQDDFFVYAKKTINRHKNLSLSFFSIILIVLTIFIVYNLIPRKYKPLPQTIRPLNIIYSPDRDTVWKFNNGDGAGGDTINFGDIAIGDALVFKFDLWNNDYKKSPLKVDLGGKDKNEFEVLWGIDKAQIEAPAFTLPDLRQKMYLKFVPFVSEGSKSAELVFYNENDPDFKKVVYLKGSAGVYKSGYSLKFKDDDYGIINPARGNVLGKEFTIAFWFKTNTGNKRLLTSDNSKWTLSKLDVGIENSFLSVGMPQPKNQSTANALRLLSNSKVKLNEWNYVVIIHKNNHTKLILNDSSVELKTEDEHFNQIEDYFILGGEQHPMQIIDNQSSYRNDGWELTFAELKMYSTALNDSEIIKSKYGKVDYTDKKLLCYYDFEEGLGHFVFDKTKNDINLELFGHPQRSLDMPPINVKLNPIYDNDKDKYIEVNKKGVVTLNKNLFEKRSSFTVQFDAKSIGSEIVPYRVFFKPETLEISYLWSYQNNDSISINFSSLLQYHKNFAVIKKKLDNNWHKYIFDYSVEGNTGRFFIDGELFAEYDFGDLTYDISRQYFCMYFGNNKNFDNPRYISENSAIDNIAIFNRTLSIDEVRSNDIKTLNGLLCYWTFSVLDGHICFDEVNKYPVFIWDEFELKVK